MTNGWRTWRAVIVDNKESKPPLNGPVQESEVNSSVQETVERPAVLSHAKPKAFLKGS